MAIVEVDLPPELQEFVRLEVQSGRYENASEVIEAALIQMKDRAAKLQEVRLRFLEADVDQLLETSPS